MKTLLDVITDLNAAIAAVTQAVTDLQSIMAVPTPPIADPVVEVDVKTAADVTTVFVPKT